MKILKLIGFLIVLLLAAILIAGALAPKNVVMTASVKIGVPDSILFNQVNNLRNWENWSPFLEADSTMENQYHGPDAGVGSQVMWQSKKEGDGMMIITRSEPNKSVKMALDFMREGSAESDWAFSKDGDSTLVTWSTRVDGLPYPMGRIMGLFMNKMMQPIFKRGFENLEVACKEQIKVNELKKQ